MNSYQLYQEIYRDSYRLNYDGCVQRAEELIRCIYSELCSQPAYGLEASPFISKIRDMAEQYNTSVQSAMRYGNADAGVTMPSWVFELDARIILLDLVGYWQNGGFARQGQRYRYSAVLFRGIPYENNLREEMEIINKGLKKIGELVSKLNNRRVEREKKRETADRKVNRQGTQAPGNISQKLEYERELTQRTQARRKENQAHIQAWHEEQAQIMAQIAQMQPAVSKLLQGFISFSDQMTDNCVLQFARSLIDLYNLIADGYSYHQRLAEESGDINYRKAVMNYEEYCSSIIDCLAPFGVEEISSAPGEGFDGKIHDAQNSADFSSRTALVKESLRTGFRYKDLILQKEKVSVEDRGGIR